METGIKAPSRNITNLTQILNERNSLKDCGLLDVMAKKNMYCNGCRKYLGKAEGTKFYPKGKKFWVDFYHKKKMLSHNFEKEGGFCDACSKRMSILYKRL